MASGAILIAAKGLFAKGLYGMGLTFHDVAAIRSVLAVPGFAFNKQKPDLDLKTLIRSNR